MHVDLREHFNSPFLVIFQKKLNYPQVYICKHSRHRNKVCIYYLFTAILKNLFRTAQSTKMERTNTDANIDHKQHAIDTHDTSHSGNSMTHQGDQSSGSSSGGGFMDKLSSWLPGHGSSSSGSGTHTDEGSGSSGGTGKVTVTTTATKTDEGKTVSSTGTESK